MAIHIQASDLVDALTSGYDLRWYLDLDTGELGPLTDEDDADELLMGRRVRAVPALDAREAYGIMERFAAAATDATLRELLAVALTGKGAFRRFKDVVHRWPDVADAWHEFHDASVLASAAEWLESEDIVAIIDRPQPAAPPKAPTSQPSQPAKPPRVGLSEMLLLGAPDGKTELIQGKVSRVFVAESAKAAQGVFADIARDMHERAGLGWRRSYIDNKTAVAVDPFELTIDGRTVVLDVEVEPALWKRFR